MENLISLPDAATAIGRHRDVVRVVAKRIGAGQMIAGRLILTAADVERIRAAIRPGRGNPAMSDPQIAAELGRAGYSKGIGAKRKASAVKDLRRRQKKSGKSAR